MNSFENQRAAAEFTKVFALAERNQSKDEVEDNMYLDAPWKKPNKVLAAAGLADHPVANKRYEDKYNQFFASGFEEISDLEQLKKGEVLEDSY